MTSVEQATVAGPMDARTLKVDAASGTQAPHRTERPMAVATDISPPSMPNEGRTPLIGCWEKVGLSEPL